MRLQAHAGDRAPAPRQDEANERAHRRGRTPTPAGWAPGTRCPRARCRRPTHCPIASPPQSTAHVIRFSGCRAAATARAAPRQSMPTNPSAMGRIPAPTRPVERHDRSYGPRNTGLAMTVKSFFRRRRRRGGSVLFNKTAVNEGMTLSTIALHSRPSANARARLTPACGPHHRAQALPAARRLPGVTAVVQ